MDMAQEIKRALTMRTVAEHYGHRPDRSGFVQCPFHHGDHTASLKIYDGDGGFHCFGCGAHGSVIDFVMQLFGLNFRQAVLRINADFCLGLSTAAPRNRIDYYAARMAAMRKEREEQERSDREYLEMVEDFRFYCEVMEAFPPILSGENVLFHPFYLEAARRLPYVEYWLDDFMERGGGSHWRTSQSLRETTI